MLAPVVDFHDPHAGARHRAASSVPNASGELDRIDPRNPNEIRVVRKGHFRIDGYRGEKRPTEARSHPQEIV